MRLEWSYCGAGSWDLVKIVDHDYDDGGDSGVDVGADSGSAGGVVVVDVAELGAEVLISRLELRLPVRELAKLYQCSHQWRGMISLDC